MAFIIFFFPMNKNQKNFYRFKLCAEYDPLLESANGLPASSASSWPDRRS